MKAIDWEGGGKESGGKEGREGSKVGEAKGKFWGEGKGKGKVDGVQKTRSS